MSKGLCVRADGFSLIELMVVVAVVGILAAVAYPTYTAQVQKARRADAQGALMAAAQLMERVYTERGCYNFDDDCTGSSTEASCSDKDSGTPGDASGSVSFTGAGTEFYWLCLADVSSNSYVLRAKPRDTTNNDGAGALELTSSGVKKWDRDEGDADGIETTEWSWD